MWKFNDVLTQGSILGGPVKGPFTARQCINLHKLLVVPVYLAMIYHFGGDLSLTQKWGPAAAVLLVCHGTYGFFWVYKDIWFPDPAWQTPMNYLGFVTIFAYPLGAYYLPMFCLVSRKCPVGYFGEGDEPWLLALGLWIYIIGFFYHFCGDLQKYVQLKYQEPRQLITSGLLAHTRNPNYFGEMCIYLGYAVLSCNWMCLPIFCAIWLQIFLPNMLGKEVSLARYEEWEDWAGQAGFFFPRLSSMIRDFCKNSLSRHPNRLPSVI